jgi:hypothetical protein
VGLIRSIGAVDGRKRKLEERMTRRASLYVVVTVQRRDLLVKFARCSRELGFDVEQ